MYKYSCRKCPIRNRCIDQSDNSTGTKIMIRHAFDARTDTLATWALLQKGCLLVQAEQERSKSALSNRLRQARAAKDEIGQVEPPPPSPLKQQQQPPKKSVIRRIQPLDKSAGGGNTAKPHTPDYLQPVSASKEASQVKPLHSPAATASSRETRGYYWLTVSNSGRHISLPNSGGIVLGRFDPNVGIPPDIDLSYEDQGIHLISRRHATIHGQDGRHTVEDLGSKSGIYLNEKQVSYGPSRPLESGDRVRLGSVELTYERVPYQILESVKLPNIQHYIMVTPTGRKIPLAPSKEYIIGRVDPQINFIPDIDLSRDGEVARLVSRRHALIRWQNGQPTLEDLGSGFGTRLAGDTLLLGQSVALKPGDHIWLAGCVLAYDVAM
jgi:pSer/pThr/pTyr-binding forkhead associated (FHA) protein